ncbi:TetR/AcrR family transcriptional regulator [Virgibacillus necropolis]|uniref:TetR/AcrR family transcriptional regulator n=1 Tax=Virgibacillus necropolis TaxID=163877 RepID=UPI001D059636|nr:TetR/AcrR family transcriptional regulator [Virgibacillus necropolis]
MKAKHNRSPGRPRSSELELPTKEIILKAASRLFLDNGYQHVSVDDVAKLCNVTKATVYYYYASKAELFTETIVQMMERIREKMHAMLQENIPLRSRLLNVTEAHLKATVDIDMDGFMKGTKNTLSPEQIKRMHQAEENMHQAIEEAFVDAMAKGEIGEINPTFATQTYLALLKVGNYKTVDNHSIFPTIEKTAEQINRFFWQGLFPE